MVQILGNTPTFKEIAGVVSKIYLKVGMSFPVRMDGGSEFPGLFLEEIMILYTLSLPYSTASNGHAEHYICICKGLLIKCIDSYRDF